jgi:hypothetical protein
MTTAEQAAAKGAALLDEEVPGWADRIDVPTLDLGSCTLCVLGQLYPEHNTLPGPDGYFLGLHQLGLSVYAGREHGFTSNGAAGITLDELAEAWSGEVHRRLRVPA